jgi:glycosyltransferase involved in cell wall biosynthesis
MNIKKNHPLVSILIPYYNHNKFIGHTLNSILDDTYPNKEILIINDGSTEKDSTNLDLWIEEHKDTINIRYKKRENKGLTKTINELLKMSSGKYIVLCASDDYLINNTIAQRVNILEKNDKKLITISDNIVIDDDGNKLYNSNLFELRNNDKERYLTDNGLKYVIIKRWSFAGPSWLANRELFDKIGYFDEKLAVEDWDFFLRFSAQNLAIFYDQQVSAYRLHNNNSCRSEHYKILSLENEAYSAKKNYKLFSFPYNIMLLLKYFKIMKRLKKLKKSYE